MWWSDVCYLQTKSLYHVRELTDSAEEQSLVQMFNWKSTWDVMSITTMAFVWICQQTQLHWCLTTLMSLLFVSAMETSDGHLLFPNRVSVPGQPLFPLPLLHSARDRWRGWHSHAVTHTDSSFRHANLVLGLALQACLMADLQTISSCSSSTGSALLYPLTGITGDRNLLFKLCIAIYQ